MLTLICGLPRAGKTTYSKRYEGTCKVVHLDDYGGGDKGHAQCTGAVTSDDIVVEGIYHTARWRKNLIQKYSGDWKKCIWLDTPIEVKKKRHGYCAKCEYYFEPPTYDEGWDEIIVIRGDDNEQRSSR